MHFIFTLFIWNFIIITIILQEILTIAFLSKSLHHVKSEYRIRFKFNEKKNQNSNISK